MNPLHKTNTAMARDLVALVPYIKSDVLLDPCSGSPKVWYDAFNCDVKKECEIEEGGDFFEWEEQVDWIIGNPPFEHGWDFILHSAKIARKGIAFLHSINGINSLTPARLEKLKALGLYVQSIHIVADKRWFGRYYFIIIERNVPGILTWNTTLYKD